MICSCLSNTSPRHTRHPSRQTLVNWFPGRRESWKSAPVVNAHLVDEITIRQPGFTLPRQQWSLLNRFRTSQRHCGPVERHGVLQTLICAPVVRPKRCPTSSNPALLRIRWSVPASLCCCCCYCLADQLWVLIAYARRTNN